MSKSIKFTQSQIKAYENGATMFMFPIDDSIHTGLIGRNNYNVGFIKKHSPLQIGDKDVFIKEEFQTGNNLRDIQNQPLDKDVDILYKHFQFNSNKHNKEWAEVTIWEDTSDMTKDQCRYSLKEVVDVKIVRIKEVNLGEAIKSTVGTYNRENGIQIMEYFKIIENNYSQQLKEQNISRTYNDNDYVFLIEIKR